MIRTLAVLLTAGGLWVGIQTPAQPANVAPLRIHRFETGERVQAIACSADGKLVAIANGSPTFVLMENGKSRVADNWQPTAEIIDAATGKVVTALKLTTGAEDALFDASERVPPFEVSALAFSPNGKMLAVGTTAGQVKLFEVSTGKFRLALDDQKTRLADAKTPEKLRALERALGSVESLAFSADGSQVAVGGRSLAEAQLVNDGISRLTRPVTGPGRLQIWEVQTGRLMHDLVGHSRVSCVAFSPDGRLLASAGSWRDASHDGSGVIIWNLQNGEKTRTFAKDANAGTHAVAFSQNGKQVVIGTCLYDKENDKYSTTISLAYVLSGITEWQINIANSVMPKAFMPDGKTVVVFGHQSAIQLLDVATGRIKHEIRPADDSQAASWHDVAIAVQSRLLVIGGGKRNAPGSVEVWNLGASQ